ncbi:MAG: hypothetical protein ACRER7_05935 [Gammaproteobacteria bacterium]
MNRMLQADALRLPRPLVNQLLHSAQQAVSSSQGFVLHHGTDHFLCAPLPADADLVQAARQLQKRAEQMFAFYRTSNKSLPPPAAAELQVIIAFVPLYLAVALDIKGVLQLRAWRIAGSRALELDVAISEPGTRAQ